MLVLELKESGGVTIGESIHIRVLATGKTIRLGIEAPRSESIDWAKRLHAERVSSGFTHMRHSPINKVALRRQPATERAG
jgi:sRNA-binding carbon storage regulator CsrA